ncbi:MAG: hypothetical protein HZB76_07425 [Chlamydiae bacterium]|nr:hypothetical protein [Chlamydiota bacterium]
MKIIQEIILSYCTALKENDYQTIIALFAKNSKVYSFLAGVKEPMEFFENLFSTSKRTIVDLRKIFVGLDDPKSVAAYIYLETLWAEKLKLNVEAVDLFEFDSNNKIKTLRIILDTHPIKKLKERLQTDN